MLPWAFEPGMGFERYLDYALDVPMYFVKRGNEYVDVAGQSFRDLLAGSLKSMQGERATLSDWANHLSTIFPEVRLKRYLEMRGSDSREWPVCRRAGVWVGLPTTTSRSKCSRAGDGGTPTAAEIARHVRNWRKARSATA